jgi:hypothetical protein
MAKEINPTRRSGIWKRSVLLSDRYRRKGFVVLTLKIRCILFHGRKVSSDNLFIQALAEIIKPSVTEEHLYRLTEATWQKLKPRDNTETARQNWNRATKLKPRDNTESAWQHWNRVTKLKPRDNTETAWQHWNSVTKLKPCDDTETLRQNWNHVTTLKPCDNTETAQQHWNSVTKYVCFPSLLQGLSM